jgi:hypothetical protein
MNTDILAGAAGNAVAGGVNQPDYGVVLKASAELYSVENQFAAARYVLREVSDLLRLKNLPNDEKARAAIHERAADALEQIPMPQVQQARALVQATLNDNKPSVPERKWAIGKLIDVLGIAAGDDRSAYTEAAAFELGNLEWSRLDSGFGLPDWISLPCIVHAARKLTMRDVNSYGRPPPLCQLVEQCRESRIHLVHVLQGLEECERDAMKLQQIADATEGAYFCADDD